MVIKQLKQRRIKFQRRVSAYHSYTYKDVIRRKLQFVRHWRLSENRRFAYGDYLQACGLLAALAQEPNYMLLQVSTDNFLTLKSLREHLLAQDLRVHILGRGFMRRVLNYGFSLGIFSTLFSGGHLFLVRPRRTDNAAALDFLDQIAFRPYRPMVSPLFVRALGHYIPVDRFTSMAALQNLSRQLFTPFEAYYTGWTTFLQTWQTQVKTLSTPAASPSSVV